MARLPNQSKRPRTHSSCVTQLGNIIDANLSSYDQRVIVDHGEWCLWYGFETWREFHSIFHMDLQEQVYKERFMVFLRKNRLWNDMLYWPDPLEVYIKQRTTCTEWREKMMLRFRGSDYRRSRGSTWYDRMDNLLMALGFTESKADSNLYFKVERQRLAILLLYVNDMFMIGKEELV